MRRVIFATTFALCVQAHAGDYAFQVKRINGLSERIQRKLEAIGMAPEPSNDSQGSAEDSGLAHLYRVHSTKSELRLSQGRFLFATTINRLIVGPEGSPLLVELSEGQGSFSGNRVMGVARQSASAGRLTVEFTTLLFRTGEGLPIQATALDEAGAFGLPAQVFSQRALSIAGAMVSSFVSGLASSQQSLTANAFGFQQVQPTGRNAILRGVAQTAADQSKRLIDEATAEKPVSIIESGTPVTILIEKEVRQ